jgi:hypothetical protein
VHARPNGKLFLLMRRHLVDNVDKWSIQAHLYRTSAQSARARTLTSVGIEYLTTSK